MKTKSGQCKWFNDVKGFGFVIPDDGGDDIFFHQTAIKADGYRTLHEGESVEYSVSRIHKQSTAFFNVESTFICRKFFLYRDLFTSKQKISCGSLNFIPKNI